MFIIMKSYIAIVAFELDISISAGLNRSRQKVEETPKTVSRVRFKMCYLFGHLFLYLGGTQYIGTRGSDGVLPPGSHSVSRNVILGRVD